MRRKITDDITSSDTWQQIKVARYIIPTTLRRRMPALRIGRQTSSVFQVEADAEDLHPQTGGKFPVKLASFVVLVLLPFLFSAFYYTFVAADQFTSEARFAVRSLSDASATDSSQADSLSMRAATQDAYVVMSFIHSAELLDRLGRKIDYRRMFAPGGMDALSAFDIDGSRENFLEYWKKQVSVYIDGPSGIVTLKVRTFRPDDSLQLASAIVEESETLINEMSARARNDVLRSVRGEVEKAGKSYGDSLAELSQFQHESGILSPETQAQETGKLMAKLLAEKLEIETRQFVAARSSAAQSPAYQQLKLARDSLDGQIEQLRSGLTGSSDRNLANALVRYSQLETNRMVAEKLYEATRQSYDSALTESLRKALYVVVFVAPTLPDESLYPLRVFSPLMTLLGFALLWSTLALAWASVQDHQL